jgi:hypothetical protein
VLLAVDTISSRKGHQGQQQMGTNYCLSPAARDVLADVSSSQKIEFNYYGSKCFPIVVPSDPSGKYG